MINDSKTVTVSVQHNDEITFLCQEIVAVPRPNIQWFRIQKVNKIRLIIDRLYS